MPVITRSQARKSQETTENERIMKWAADEAVKLIILFSEKNRQEKEYESRLNWFKEYCKKMIEAVAITLPGIDRMRLNYELFFVINEYFPEILQKERQNDSYLRLACAIYRKAFEFYCDSEQTVKKYIGFHDEKYVMSFVKYLGELLTNLEELFYDLDLVMVLEKVDCYNYVLKELKRVEYFENIDPHEVMMNWGTNYLSYRESKRIYL
jgi:hypothetical protein